MGYIKWNPNALRGIQRELDEKLGDLKVTVPLETEMSARRDVRTMNERERQLLNYLGEQPDGMARYSSILAAFKWALPTVDDAAIRLEQRGFVEVSRYLGNDDSPTLLRLTDAGKVAHTDLRELPEREKREAAEAKRKHRQNRLTFMLEKIIIPVIVGLLVFWLGRLSVAYGPLADPPRPSIATAPTSQP
jgi:DNA-binding MarR family transcriptional regulator